MQNFKKKLVVLSAVIVVALTSFTVVSKKTTAPSPEKVAAISNAIDAAKADGKITYSELKNIATIAKGEKLSLKERIALKVFGKKIGNKMLTTSDSGGGKSQMVALILCILVGGLGIHRFYLGYTWQGIVQLLTGGGCGIWALIDLIRIITGSLKPKDGDYGTSL